MNELEKITIKYHKHLEENAKEGMMYFTLEDVHKCMKEYHESKSDCISNVSDSFKIDDKVWHIVDGEKGEVFEVLKDKVGVRWESNTWSHITPDQIEHER